ncbi:DNA repair protein RecO [Sulfobacillus harzensis]|uniref:DNA repair protein RecO n=1 Tax=Sulfobacillus harzensis TaxID=2729629 RepID=A0A7Y0L4E2_9FIRM|nr:DNA repair protein RecO [Sulfobacillus harzensis]
MAIYEDQIITLKSRAYRDHDQLLTVFGLNNGKFGAIAKGTRRPKSKLLGQLAPLSQSVATFYHGRSSLDTVTEAELVQGFPHIAEDLERLSWAMVLADVVDQLWPEREPSEDIFTVLLSALDGLNGGRSPATVGLAAGFHCLSIAGFQPDWRQCSQCHRPFVSGPIVIQVQHGTLYCPDCRRAGDGEDSISLGSLRSLQYWLKEHPRKFGQAEVKGVMKDELQTLFFRFLLHETNRSLKSYDFLANIDRLKHGPEGGSA